MTQTFIVDPITGALREFDPADFSWRSSFRIEISDEYGGYFVTVHHQPDRSRRRVHLVGVLDLFVRRTTNSGTTLDEVLRTKSEDATLPGEKEAIARMIIAAIGEERDIDRMSASVDRWRTGAGDAVLRWRDSLR